MTRQDVNDIEWFELEPGLDFDDSDIDGERAVRAWCPDVDLAAGSYGTVYQLDDGSFKAEGNDDFSDLRTLGYFDNIEEAKQAVINSMETDGWLPYYNDINNIPSKHTGPLPTRKMNSMRKSSIRFAYGKHRGTSDFEEYSKALQEYLPASGEGDTMASQTATAVNMIVYRFFNDGDTIWSDACRSCADWLYENAGSEVSDMIDSISDYVFAGFPTVDELNKADEYTYLGWLGELLDYVCYGSLLESLADEPATGSIYDCSDLVTEAYISVQFFEGLKEELDYICPEYDYTLEDADINCDHVTFNITGDAFDVEVMVYLLEDGKSCAVEITSTNTGRLVQFSNSIISDQCAEAIVERLSDIYQMTEHA